jgi:hypothetical protein
VAKTPKPPKSAIPKNNPLQFNYLKTETATASGFAVTATLS